MSDLFREVDMKQNIKYHSVVFNQIIPLNPCIGCIHRGGCEGEQYAEVGSYCRHKQIVQEVVNAR